jgi:alkane 1-monooxygenase
MKGFLHRIGFFTAFLVPLFVIAGFYLGGSCNYISILFSFVLLPLIDHNLGRDTSNVPAHAVERVGEDLYYRFVTYIWTWFQLGFFVWGFYAVATGELKNAFDWIGFTVGFALVTGGIGITVAHELGHKKAEVERFYSKVLLMTVCYMHFYIEHNRGHHVYVATPEDPATARMGESFYRFWVRSVFGQYRHSWRIVSENLHRKGVSPISLQNEMVWFTLIPLAFCALATIAFSYYFGRVLWEIPVFFFAQSFLAFTLLELVNYIEHYGIVRKEIEPGRYERVNPVHSWNASHMISNFFLFQLQRHSDHHVAAYKRYQVLDHYDESPQLPYGYPTMIMIAMVPPLWFAMMDRRLQSWRSAVTIS